MKKLHIFLFLIFILLFFMTNILKAQVQCGDWTKLSLTNAGLINGIKFFDANTGYIVSGGTDINIYLFLKTTNGGTNWVVSNPGIMHALYGMSFVNRDTGYVSDILHGFHKTFNAGINWISVGQPSVISRNFCFINANTGICMSSRTAYKTTNGGLNWFDLFTAEYGNRFQDIKMLNQDTIIISGDYWPDRGVIWVSYDGGSTWITHNEFPGLDNMTSISFYDDRNGIVASGESYICKTTDAGQNWTQICDFTIDYKTVFYIDSMRIYEANQLDGSVSFTTDGGNVWIKDTCFMGNQLVAIYFINALTGWVAGGISWTSAIYKTTDGGLSFTEQLSHNIPVKFTLYQNYPNPFNPSTKISFDLPKTGYVKLTIFDVLGREVETLVNENLKAGKYEAVWDASKYSSDVYYYKLISQPSDRFERSDGYIETKKMVFLK